MDEIVKEDKTDSNIKGFILPFFFFLLNTLSYLNNNNAIKDKHPNKHVTVF